MNRSIWRKALITDVLLSFGLCFGIIAPALIVRGIEGNSDLILVALVISLVMFIIGLPIYLLVFKSQWDRNN